MSNVSEEIFSQRIVIVDFYMNQPIYGLDPTYSEFRGHEITKVPVIRIFGSNLTGEKVCMHVHGVFPYFYIPYESSDVGDVDQAVYLIASSIDKAINISLGQGSSNNQHVFKIQLVKGIPFYGYHKREHQYLKIYLYNPRFVKRVANLFQNGAILGKMFQPHESHVPYILQFFIDYNLYGMSFLHVPMQIIKYRQDNNRVEVPSYIEEEQLLPEKIVRMSTSRHEIDIAAAFIINRYQQYGKDAQCSNPGIEAIWQDERVRRQDSDQEMPNLEIASSGPRISAESTESDIFYLAALRRKLTDEFLEQTALSDSTLLVDNKKKTFNLKLLLSNSVYPSECSQELESIKNASTIENHLSRESAFHTSLRRSRTSSDRTSNDQSFIDESMVLSLSQNKQDITLQQEDLDVLAVMEQLEQDDDNIDPDSTLAPLSQTYNMSVITKEDDAKTVLNTTTCVEVDDISSDENEDYLNYTITLDDVDENYFKDGMRGTNKTPSTEQIPQLDGANDLIKTPPRRSFRNKTINSKNTTPKKATRSKYAPLDIQTIQSPDKNKRIIQNGNSYVKSIENPLYYSPYNGVKHKPPKNAESLNEIIKVKRQIHLSSQHEHDKVDDNKRIVTCSLRNHRKDSITEAPLKVYNVHTLQNKQTIKIPIKKCKVKLKKLLSTDLIKYTLGSAKTVEQEQYEKENSNILPDKQIDMHTSKVEDEKLNTGKVVDTNNAQRQKNWSPSDIAREYDLKNNFFPQPGPSGINFAQNSPKCTPPTMIDYKDQSIVNDELNICSFYDKSFLMDSPSIFSSGESPASLKENFSLMNSYSRIPHIASIGTSRVIVTPEQLPPTYEEVKNNLAIFDIPEMKYVEPFYGDSADVTNKREIGQTVLRIPGRSLNDLEDFASLFPNLNGINSWRRNMLKQIAGENICENLNTNSSIREYFADKRRIIITTLDLPPTRHEANLWIKAREMYLKNNENYKDTNNENEDSPIKVKREKVKMILNENVSDSDDNSIIDRSFTMSPLTPVNSISRIKNLPSDSSGKTNESATTPFSFIRSLRKTRKSKARLSLTKRLNNIRMNELIKPKNEDESWHPKIRCITPEKIMQPKSIDVTRLSGTSNETSITDDSIKTDVVKKVLERSSFVKNLNLDDNNLGHNDSFGLSGATLNNTYGFKVNYDNLQKAKTDIEYNYLTIFVTEIFVPTRKDLQPNPEFDPVMCLFFSIVNNVPKSTNLPCNFTGIIMVGSDLSDTSFLSSTVDTKIVIVENEKELFIQLIELSRFWDPDIFAGYEIEMNSWGYLMDRARTLEIDLAQLLSRVPSQKIREHVEEDREQLTEFDVELKLCGRILLDVWRLLRSEIALTSYTFENVVYHILHKRCPLHSYKDLTKWFNVKHTQWIVLEYYLERVKGVLNLLDQLDLIGRTSEMAKLIGIQFYEVLSRGSQFRVESMMLRVAKPKNLVPVSPSVKQRAHMRAPEYLPLILEPQSRFYTDPIIVLDFQSLYPSMIIAYNYCFSTCLGRVEHLGQSAPFEFGASQLKISKNHIKSFLNNELVTSSPCGVVFVKPAVREGILPRLLQEILDTRLMVKQSMKIHKDQSALQKILHSRQLALKLIANVTYGYTAANFSGRMPCVEVADSIVAKGRETLERAIKLVEANENWRAKVVYGDTDSLFVLVKGRSREDAFKIGEEIVEAVTNDNPQPVKLKLEKVYHPCILQTKKRYVGYMYESVDQAEPVYEAKGIETVRRDGCPAVAKMLEKCIRILFSSRDVSEIKKYVCRQFTKLLTGHANTQDLIFAKEFRGRHGYKAGACVPALELTRRWLKSDPRKEPRRGERVPFLIISGPPGVPLIRLVRSPHEFLADDGLKINAIYYITKAIIPPINRCMLLIGADLNEWFATLPRKNIIIPKISIASELVNTNLSKKSTISQYFSSANCVVDCGRQTKYGICAECRKDVQKSVHVLKSKISRLERMFYLTEKVCQSCCGRLDHTSCQSLDCPVLFVLKHKERSNKEIPLLENLVEEILCD